MQLFAIAQRSDPLPGMGVADAIRAAARHFPFLDDRSFAEGVSEDGGLEFAAIAHPAEVAAPRRYFARHGHDVVLYDGLPIDRHGRFPAFDAHQLLLRWPELADALEGVFCAVRIDLAAGRVECLPDMLGMARVYFHSCRGGWVLGNSLAAVSQIAGAARPDPLGVSSLLTFGWPIRGHTPVDGVELLSGGHFHELDTGGLRSRPHFAPRDVAPRRQGGGSRSAAEVAEALTRTIEAAGSQIRPLHCGVTAGRDTRVLVALSRAAGWDARYYTSGAEGDIDVEIAREISDRLQLPHMLVTPRVPERREEWTTATAQFVAQTDGFATLLSIDDWIDHQQPIQPLGLKLWGAGGEIGRPAAGIGMGTALAANAWGLCPSFAPQQALLRRKVHGKALFRAEALEVTRAALDAFVRERADEGWRPRDVLATYYTFERVAHWAAGGARRAAAATDLYSPFTSRDNIEWCFSLSAGERLAEAPHWRLLSELSPELRDMRFQYPWRPRAAQALMLGEIVRRRVADLRRKLPRTNQRSAMPRPSFAARWLEAGLDVHRELCLSHASSPLWEFVDRVALEGALAASADELRSQLPSICTALTAFWWFHGRGAGVPAPSRPHPVPAAL